MSFNSIDLALLNDLLNQGEIIPDALRDGLLRMGPEGSLSSFNLGRNQQGFYIAANLDDCNLKPFKGFPGPGKSFKGFQIAIIQICSNIEPLLISA